MKKFYFLATLALSVFATSVNAQETEEYDFVAASPESGFEANGYWGEEPVYVVSTNADASHGGMVGGQTLEMYPIAGPNGETWGNRLAGQKRGGSWTYRNAGTWKGLWSQYDRWISILNVKPGDKLTFTVSPGTQIQYDDLFMVTEESPAEIINTTEGEERHAIDVTIEIDAAAENPNLVMYSTKSSYIEKLVIESSNSTGITEHIAKPANPNKIYNLQGMPMKKAKGLCIIGGKKVIK